MRVIVLFNTLFIGCVLGLWLMAFDHGLGPIGCWDAFLASVLCAQMAGMAGSDD